MAHFDFVRPDGNWWPASVPNSADFQRWDTKQDAAVNGDLGGTYAPSSPIVIGGAGLSMGTLSRCTGGVATATGGRLVLGTAVGDFPLLAPFRSRTITLPADERVMRVDPSSIGSMTVPVPSRYLHDGAPISGIGIRFVVPTPNFTIPGTYTVPTINLNVHTLVGAPGTATAPDQSTFVPWTASTAFTLGQYIIPSSPAKNNGWYTKVVTAGTSGGTEPTWSSTFGTFITDGSATLRTTGRNGILPTAGQSPHTLYNNGQPSMLALDYDPNALTSIALVTSSYALIVNNILSLIAPTISNVSVNIKVLGAFISFANISSLQPA